MRVETRSSTIIIGASGGLGSALCRRWQRDSETDHVFAVSRQAPSEQAVDQAADKYTTEIQHIQCDYTESSITSACEEISKKMNAMILDAINRVCICNGVLHDNSVSPEKRLEDISIDSLQHVFMIK